MIRAIWANYRAMREADRVLEAVPVGDGETPEYLAANRRAFDAWQALPRAIRWIWS